MKHPNTRHGHSAPRSPTYRTWRSMRARCENPNATGFSRYGGRGIAVCARWHVFENFLADMGERPDGTSIDRQDNARDYEPDNCRWSTPTEQSRNRRNNKLCFVAVCLIRHLSARGCRRTDVARAFGVTSAMVSKIVTRQTWNHGGTA